MFEQFIREKAIAMATALTTKLNEDIKNEYLQAASNWAETKQKGEAGPPPVAPNGLQFVFNDATNGFELVDNGSKVSNIKPEDFLPTFQTNTNTVGGPVGGPIPDNPGRFYIAADAGPVYAGQIYNSPSGVFVLQQPTPFQKFWFKIA